MELIRSSDIAVDAALFNWLYRAENINTIYPPVVSEIGYLYYQLNNFNIESDNYILIDFNSISDIIMQSVYLNGGVTNLVELSNVHHISEYFNDNSRVIKDFFASNGIKGNNSFQILRNIKKSSNILKDYLVKKDVPLRLLTILFRFSDELFSLIIDFIQKESPSIGDFRKFILQVNDYKEFIAVYLYEKGFIDNIIKEKNSKKNEFFSELSMLCSCFKFVNIANDNNFENDTVNFSFSVDSYDMFITVLDELSANKDNIKKIFDKSMSLYKLTE